jgi:tRNA modification GTPase
LSERGLEILELTPRGRGGVSVVTVRGPGALELVRGLASGAPVLLGRPSLVRVRSGGELLDEALVYAESEREVELHLHGAPVVVGRVLELLATRAPATEVRPSLEDRAWALLAGAKSEAAARTLLDQAEGALRAELRAVLDEPDRAASRRRLQRLLDTAVVARRLLELPKVVIAGPANAGKSTLFNLLLGTERAIVDPAPGTTRDALSEPACLGEYAVELQDTAGGRPLPGNDRRELVESEGQELARSLARGADLVLWLRPPWDDGPPPPSGGPVRILRSRADEHPAPGAPSISCLRAPGRARAVVEDAFHEALALPRDPWKAGEPMLFTGGLVELVRGLVGRSTTRDDLHTALDPLLRR